jgi:hypothetical protein
MTVPIKQISGAARFTGCVLYHGATTTDFSDDATPITTALAAAASGDIVLIGPEDFGESFTIPTNVTVRGAMGDGQARITGGAATGARITMSNLSRLENVSITLPTDATAAIKHALAAPGVSFVNNVELYGNGGTGIGIEHSGQGSCVVRHITYRSGTSGNVFKMTAASTGVMDVWDVALGGGTITNAIDVDAGTFAVTRLSAPANVTITDGINISAGVFSGVAMAFTSGCTNGLHVTADNCVISLQTFRADTTVPILVDPAVTTGSLSVNSGSFKADLVDAPQAYIAQDAVVLIFEEESAGDRGLNIWGELHVGSFEAGKEAVFGGGDSHTRGMKVFTNTNLLAGAWVDETADAASGSGSTFTLFPGVGADNCLYIGGDLPFPGVKLSGIATALVTGALGEVVAEVWTGAAFAEIHFMCADANSPYDQHAETFMERAGGTSEQIRFGDTTGWAASTVNGSLKYWMRFRIDTAITTAPVCEQNKVHTDRFEANADGYTEKFGAARPEFDYPISLANMLAVQGFAPKDENLEYSPTVELIALKNEFANTAKDGTGGKVTILAGTDTSFPLIFRAKIMPLVTGGDYEMELVTAALVQGTALDGLAAEIGGASRKIVKTAGTAHVPQEFEWEVDISHLLPGDTVAFAFFRDATGVGPPDTLVGSVAMESLRISAVRWK